MDLSAATDRSGVEPIPHMPSVADYWPDRPGAPAADPAQQGFPVQQGVLPQQSKPEQPRPPAGPSEPPAEPSEPPAEPSEHMAGPAERVAEIPRHAAEIKFPVLPGQSRVRLTLGVAVALALLVVIAGVLATLVKQAHSQPASSAAPAAIPPASAASLVPTGPAAVAPAPTAKAALPRPPVLPPEKVPKPSAPKLPAAATFEVAATDRSVTVRSRDLGTDLYRVTLAKGGPPVTAKVKDSGQNHRLTLVKDSTTTAPPVTITLNSAIRWSLKLTAGNTETTVNLTESKFASLELAGGADLVELSLPPVTGTLPVRVTHGLKQLKIKTNGIPLRLTLDVGASTVKLDGDTHTGNKPGTVLTSDGWARATNRVDLEAVVGIGTLTVDTD